MISLSLTAGQCYHVLVEGWGGRTGTFSLLATCPSATRRLTDFDAAWNAADARADADAADAVENANAALHRTQRLFFSLSVVVLVLCAAVGFVTWSEGFPGCIAGAHSLLVVVGVTVAAAMLVGGRGMIRGSLQAALEVTYGSPSQMDDCMLSSIERTTTDADTIPLAVFAGSLLAAVVAGSALLFAHSTGDSKANLLGSTGGESKEPPHMEMQPTSAKRSAHTKPTATPIVVHHQDLAAQV